MVALVRVPCRSAVQRHFHVPPVFYQRHCRAFGTADFDARKGDRERVVILGSGWGGQVPTAFSEHHVIRLIKG